jgi:hypothetical protein
MVFPVQDPEVLEYIANIVKTGTVRSPGEWKQGGACGGDSRPSDRNARLSGAMVLATTNEIRIPSYVTLPVEERRPSEFLLEISQRNLDEGKRAWHTYNAGELGMEVAHDISSFVGNVELAQSLENRHRSLLAGWKKLISETAFTNNVLPFLPLPKDMLGELLERYYKRARAFVGAYGKKDTERLARGLVVSKEMKKKLVEGLTKAAKGFEDYPHLFRFGLKHAASWLLQCFKPVTERLAKTAKKVGKSSKYCSNATRQRWFSVMRSGCSISAMRRYTLVEVGESPRDKPWCKWKYPVPTNSGKDEL